ncbi:MAG TPA: acetate kinase [Microbacteriaceae bacterium]|nr:acetate kinase [Microbacteriaceae bacterium]
MKPVLVINSGSSSFKYQLLDMDREETLARGLVERIGEDGGHASHTREGAGETAETFERSLPIPDHTAGFRVMVDAFAAHGPSLGEHPPVAVGHRVVHGGERFVEPTLVTDEVEQGIEDLADLAPLHNPANVQGIRAARSLFPGLPHVAVFDTAFHQSLPPAAYHYAIDPDLAGRLRIRRYGFHGTSHKYVSEAAARFLRRPAAEVKQLVLHLGNGASVTAVDGGLSVETSMGMTPLEGLVMGTRSGDIDPAVLLYLQRHGGYDVDGLDDLLNKHSGLLGMSGHRDMRDVQAAAAAGDKAATDTLAVYLHRLKSYVGAYYAQLGHLDVISFTAGIGENNAAVRAGSLAGLDELGIVVDPARNEAPGRGVRRISADDSRVAVLVVPTDEELEIARQTLRLAAA